MDRGQMSDDGFTLIELLIVVAIIGIIAGISIPGLLRARMSADEASALGSLRALHSAQATFAASCGGGGYASSVDALATAPAGGQPFIGPDLVKAYLAPGKGGYQIETEGLGAVVRPSDKTCNDVDDSTVDYLATSTPVTVGVTGQRSFGSTGEGVIYQDSSGTKLAVPLVAGGTISRLQ